MKIETKAIHSGYQPEPTTHAVAVPICQTAAYSFDNAPTVAKHLEDHARVCWVRYAGLDSSPHKALPDKYMGGRGSGISSFGIKGGAAAGTKFIDALQLITRLVNIGDAKSLACHPASTTHRQLSEEELAASGVSTDLVRLSIGIENVTDISEDTDQALRASA